MEEKPITREMIEFHVKLTGACRREAIEKKDKAYIRRCDRLLKKLAKQLVLVPK